MEDQTQNNLEKLTYKLFGSYKKSLVSLFILVVVLAIPITLGLVQQQQDLRQRASGTDFPNGVTMSMSPSTANPTTNPTISTTVNSGGSPTQGYRRYIFKSGDNTTTQDIQPTPGVPSVGAYDPSNIAVGKIYYIDAQPTFNTPPFDTPKSQGRYYVFVNAYNTDSTCDWSGAVWRKQSNGSFIKDTTATCLNSSKTLLTVSSSGTTTSNVSVSNLAYPNPGGGTLAPSSQASITANGKGGSIGVYIFKSSTGNPPDAAAARTNPAQYPSGGNYTNGQKLNADTIYQIGAVDGTTFSKQITLPPEPGTYYLLANSHSETLANWWSKNGDLVCPWYGNITENVGNDQSGYKITASSTTCPNPGPVKLSIETGQGTSTNPSVTGITFNPTTGSAGQSVNVTVAGTGGKEWLYLFMNPTPPDVQGAIANPALYPTSQSYDPSNVTAGTFYKVGTPSPNGSVAVTLPSNIGSNNIYFVANAHSDPTNTTVAWQADDNVCAWQGIMYHWTTSGVQAITNNGVQQTCNNVGPQQLPTSQNSGGTGGNGGTGGSGGSGGTGGTGGTGGSGGTPSTGGTETPAPTQPMSNNQLAVAVQLPGIGTAAGDNKNPKNPTRDVEVWVYDTNNNLVKDVKGQVTFDGTNMYKGNVDLGDGFNSGFYNVKIRMNNTLKKLVPGIQNIQANGVNTSPPPASGSPTPTGSCPYPYPFSLYLCPGTVVSVTPTSPLGNPRGVLAAHVTNLPVVTLVPGDLDPDQDNVLDIKDYNVFMSCFGDKQCSQKQQADFNDDGVVNGIDYNILVRGFAIRSGD